MNTRWTEPVALLLLASAAFLVWTAVVIAAYYPTPDTGTVGLMACHILDGEHPLFYYGQHYLGALEAYVAAGFVYLLGPTILAPTLAPILFSLAWMASVWLLCRELFGGRVGLAAAALIAFPPWHVLWYSVGTYGGYPEAWFFGAIALWAAVRQWTAPAADRHGAARFALLGTATGLGLWCNPQSLMLLGVAWTVASVHLLLHPPRRGQWAGPLWCAALLALTSAPVWRFIGDYRGSAIASWTFRPAILVERVHTFLVPGLRTLVFSRESLPGWWQGGVAFALGLGSILLVAVLVESIRSRHNWLLFAPLAVVLCCILLSLPHDMADEHAPRYLIPLWAALVVWVFALPLRLSTQKGRCLAAVALGVWLVLQLGATVSISLRKRPDKLEALRHRDKIAAASRDLGNPYIYLVGNEIFGHMGQPWNYHAGGQSRFLSSFDERCRKTAQAAETADSYALACRSPLAAKLQNTLAALDVDFCETSTPTLHIMHALDVPVPVAEGIRPASAVIQGQKAGDGDAGNLFDRRWDTSVCGEYGGSTWVEIDFGEAMPIDSLVLFSPHWFHDDLPAALRVDVSTDGATFHTAREPHARFSTAYRAGGRVYVKGYLGCLELALGGIEARTLRLVPEAGSSRFTQWTVNEVFVFRSRSVPDGFAALPGIAALRDVTRKSGVTFVFADRTQSARLWQDADTSSVPAAFPRYNPKFADTLKTRTLAPADTIGILVDGKYAQVCTDLLVQCFGPNVIRDEQALGVYVFLALADVPAVQPGIQLIWNGHTLLANTGPEPRWH